VAWCRSPVDRLVTGRPPCLASGSSLEPRVGCEQLSLHSGDDVRPGTPLELDGSDLVAASVAFGADRWAKPRGSIAVA